jgi:hypothetical protein
MLMFLHGRARKKSNRGTDGHAVSERAHHNTHAFASLFCADGVAKEHVNAGGAKQDEVQDHMHATTPGAARNT